jgi:hypothetical protein
MFGFLFRKKKIEKKDSEVRIEREEVDSLAKDIMKKVISESRGFKITLFSETMARRFPNTKVCARSFTFCGSRPK